MVMPLNFCTLAAQVLQYKMRLQLLLANPPPVRGGKNENLNYHIKFLNLTEKKPKMNTFAYNVTEIPKTVSSTRGMQVDKL